MPQPAQPITKTVTERVEKVLSLIRPAIQADGGDLELVEVTADGVARIRLLGACVGCPSSTVTLQMGIERNLRTMFPRSSASNPSITIEPAQFDSGRPMSPEFPSLRPGEPTHAPHANAPLRLQAAPPTRRPPVHTHDDRRSALTHRPVVCSEPRSGARLPRADTTDMEIPQWLTGS